MASTDPPSRDDVLAGTSEIVAGAFGLLRARERPGSGPPPASRVLLSVSSIAGGIGLIRGDERLKALKVAALVGALVVLVADRLRPGD